MLTVKKYCIYNRTGLLMARHVFYRTSISYCMQNKYSSNACRCSTSVNNLICNWLVLPLCFILQTAVFHREPATALTATERPRFWGTFLAPPVSSRVCVCVSPTLTHTHSENSLYTDTAAFFTTHQHWCACSAEGCIASILGRKTH